MDMGKPFLGNLRDIKSLNFEKCFNGAITSNTFKSVSKLRGKSEHIATVAFNCFCDFLNTNSLPNAGGIHVAFQEIQTFYP